MPLYEYHCETCQADVEVLVRSVQEVPECPECHSHELTKQLSAPAAPAMVGASLPVRQPSGGGTCGRPQCGTGCMFD